MSLHKIREDRKKLGVGVKRGARPLTLVIVLILVLLLMRYLNRFV